MVKAEDLAEEILRMLHVSVADRQLRHAPRAIASPSNANYDEFARTRGTFCGWRNSTGAWLVLSRQASPTAGDTIQLALVPRMNRIQENPARLAVCPSVNDLLRACWVSRFSPLDWTARPVAVELPVVSCCSRAATDWSGNTGRHSKRGCVRIRHSGRQGIVRVFTAAFIVACGLCVPGFSSAVRAKEPDLPPGADAAG